jgi:hypothetical protein
MNRDEPAFRLDKLGPYSYFPSNSRFSEQYVIGYLFRKLRAFLLPERVSDESIDLDDPVEVLSRLYNHLTNLAHQLDKHAESAPYPHVSDQLHRLANEKRQSAALVKDKIESLRGWVKENSAELASGRNHWERVTKDLKDQKNLEDFLLVQEARLVHSPDLAELLRRLAVGEQAHRKILEEMAARADPQAHQT